MSSVEDLLRGRSMSGRISAAGREKHGGFPQGLGLGLLLSIPFWLGAVALLLH
ncbi:MAG: hypothetical protein U1E52_08760 [Geminicoccaceae bacterium]